MGNIQRTIENHERGGNKKSNYDGFKITMGIANQVTVHF
jgi:hypothetical protein